LEIFKETGNRTYLGTTLSNIGGVYGSQKRYEEAINIYQQVLDVFKEMDNIPLVGAVQNNLGAMYNLQKKDSEALESYQQALATFREIGDRANEGAILNNIGRVYGRQMKYAEALDLYQQALVIRREVNDKAGEGVTLNNIGAVYYEEGRFTDALEYYEQAMTIIEKLRSVAGGDQDRANFIAQYAFLYDRAIELYIQQNQPEKAFLTTERGRARSFLDSMATGYVELNNNTASALYAQEQDAYTIRKTVQDALLKAKAQTSPDEQQIIDLETQLAQAEKEYQVTYLKPSPC
jgi:tetratricopeptide (TPR) repeat protein